MTNMGKAAAIHHVETETIYFYTRSGIGTYQFVTDENGVPLMIDARDLRRSRDGERMVSETVQKLARASEIFAEM